MKSPIEDRLMLDLLSEDFELILKKKRIKYIIRYLNF